MMQRKWLLSMVLALVAGVSGGAWVVLHWAQDPELVTYHGHTEDIWSVAFSPDGRLLASGDRLGMVKVIETKAGKERATLHLADKRGSVVAVAFSPDGQVLAALIPVEMKQWRVETWEEQPALEQPCGGIAGAFSPDNALFAVADGAQSVIVWDRSTGKRRHVHTQEPSQEVCALAFGPDSKSLVFAGTKTQKDHQVPFIAWMDMTTGKAKNLYEGESDRISIERLTYLSPQLLAFGEGSLVRVLDLENGKVQEVCAAVYPCLAASGDGRLLAVGDSDAFTLTLYEAPSWKKTRSVRGHAEEIKALALSRDGKFLASASFDKTVKVWNLSRLPKAP